MASRCSGRGRPLGVTRLEAAAIRKDPDLQEVERLGGRGIDFAMPDAGAGAHDLDLAGSDLRLVAEAVAVLDRALEYVTEDFHVTMRVHREANPGRDDVLIDHAQRTEAHVGGVVVIGEAEGMPGAQPAVVGMAAFAGAADGQVHPGRMAPKGHKSNYCPKKATPLPRNLG